MKKVHAVNIKKVLAIAMCTVTLASAALVAPCFSNDTIKGFSITADAATAINTVPVWCQITGNSNIPTYSSIGGSRSGSIYPNDNCKIKKIYESGWVLVEYPTSKGTKSAYAKSSAFFTNVNFSTSTKVTAKNTTVYYKSNCSSKIGTTTVGDKVRVIGSQNGNQQILYPVSGGYKMGFVKGNLSVKSSSSVTTSWQLPLSGAFCSWRSSSNWSWANNRYGSGHSNDRVYHLGVDIKGSSDNVYAAASGSVSAAGWNNANGNYVVIKHSLNGKTIYSFYAHLNSRCVSVGKPVSKGEKIGVVGNTGSSSAGKHLHFAIVDKLKSGSYYGYATRFSGNKVTYNGVTYYNPIYIINNNKLP